VAHAELWDSQASNTEGYNNDACRLIAKAVKCDVLEWAGESHFGEMKQQDLLQLKRDTCTF
jgi:hypothetical protein